MERIADSKLKREESIFMPVPHLRDAPKHTTRGGRFFLPPKDTTYMPTKTVSNILRHNDLDGDGPCLIKEEAVYSDLEIAKLLYRDKEITKWRLNATRQLMRDKKLKGRKVPGGTWVAYGRSVRDYLLK